jgi:peroxiredoxin/Spy/CpxP family protein refolding chaperone
MHRSLAPIGVRAAPAGPRRRSAVAGATAWRVCAAALVGMALALGGAATVSRAADPFRGADPVWSLLHEPALARELRLTTKQQQRFRALLDEHDARFFPLRNRSGDDAAREVTAVLDALLERVQDVIDGRQWRRLTEVRTRLYGTTAVLRPGLAEQLDLTGDQRERIEEVVLGTARAVTDLEKRAADGEPRGPLEERYAALRKDELRDVSGILTPAQRAVWQRALGRDFDLGSLGQPVYRAPEFIDSGHWVGGEPVRLADLAGKVVVVHFYAFGCHNCVANYPTYREWRERFHADDVVIVGIHTPETSAEEDVDRVRQAADDAGFTFPVLVDGDKANWNAWGNSMWPSVYVVDRQGYLRHFWPGELRWKGATGDAWIAERIEALLEERRPPAP